MNIDMDIARVILSYNESLALVGAAALACLLVWGHGAWLMWRHWRRVR